MHNLSQDLETKLNNMENYHRAMYDTPILSLNTNIDLDDVFYTAAGAPVPAHNENAPGFIFKTYEA